MNESPWEQAVRLTQAAMRAPEIKRFYATAAAGEVDGGYALLLDGRGARTPTKNRLDAVASPLSAWNRTASRLI